MTAATVHAWTDPRPRRTRVDLLDPAERLADYGLVVSDPLEACVGLLVVHADGTAECLESSGCAPDPVLHSGLVSCADALGDCCEGPEAAR